MPVVTMTDNNAKIQTPDIAKKLVQTNRQKNPRVERQKNVLSKQIYMTRLMKTKVDAKRENPKKHTLGRQHLNDRKGRH